MHLNQLLPFSLLLLAACSANPLSQDGSGDDWADRAPAQKEQALVLDARSPASTLDLEVFKEVPKGTFDIDTQGIGTTPGARLPRTRLGLGAYNADKVASALIQTKDRFKQTSRLNTRLRLESAQWFLEVDEVAGTLLILSREGSGKAVHVDESALQQASLQRLQKWGVGKGEVFKVLQRQLLAQAETDRGVEEAKLHRYKTFVLRGYNGVPVESHRAVVTYGPDGAFRRALAAWPPLAKAGHKLRTKLNTAQIRERAISALRENEETEGRVALSWQYVPTETSTGEVTLELVARARLEEVQHGDVTEEARVFNVPVDAY